jgi:hypothetical protein
MNTHKTCMVIGSGVVLAALAMGCDPAGDADAAVALRPGTGTGGVWLNTNAIGAHAFSEIDLKGAKHDGVRLKRVRLAGGVQLDRVEFDAGGQLRGVKGTTHYRGADLIDSQWELALIAGSTETPATMTIAGIEAVGADETRYVFVHPGADGLPTPVCEADASGSHAAVPIKNLSVDVDTGVLLSRKDTLYLACTSGAVGKAVTWGYKPWKRSVDEFEAAVRMVRADYCYDGSSWTTRGTGVQVRDKSNINTFLHWTDPTEAVWGKDHLHCLSAPRGGAFTAAEVTCNGEPLPACPNNLAMNTYGADTLFWVRLNST